jgi:hypothetical protein
MTRAWGDQDMHGRERPWLFALSSTPGAGTPVGKILATSGSRVMEIAQNVSDRSAAEFRRAEEIARSRRHHG